MSGLAGCGNSPAQSWLEGTFCARHFPSAGEIVPQLRSPWLHAHALPTPCYKSHCTLQPPVSSGPVPLSVFGMALHMVLVVLSLLPLLEAQNPEPANITLGIPITNETLKWVSACLGPGPDHCRCLFSLWAFLSLSVFLSGLPVLPFPFLGIVVASPCLQTQKHHSEVSRQGTEP